MTSPLDKKVGSFFAGLIFPISSFIYALLHPEIKNFKLLFVMFFTFLGIASFYNMTGGADYVTYMKDFLDAGLMKDVGFWDYFYSRNKSQQIDYYSSFICWFVSRFSSNYRVYFGILAMIMALFFAANINYLIQHVELSKINILLLIVFALTPQFVFLTHRWWTALQVFLFGFLPVVVEKKYIRLIWCFFAVVVFHFSFVYPFILLVLALFMPKRQLWLYLLIYLISLLMNSFNFDYFTPYFEAWMPELTADRTSMYINYELQYHNFLSQSARIAFKVINVLTCTLLLFTQREQLYDNKVFRRFYVIVLLLGSFANLTALTEWGWRFYDLCNMAFVAFYMLFLSDKVNYDDCVRFFRCLSPLFLYFIIYQIRGFLDVIGPFQMIAGNYFTTWFFQDNCSVLDLIKRII